MINFCVKLSCVQLNLFSNEILSLVKSRKRLISHGTNLANVRNSQSEATNRWEKRAFIATSRGTSIRLSQHAG